jgi:molybdopterin-guanine dinucleotide biosynthesis protein A
MHFSRGPADLLAGVESMIQKSLTAAVLAGGNSLRFGSEKSLALLRGIPLVIHAMSTAQKLSDRVIIVLSDERQESEIRHLLPDVEIVRDPDDTEKSALNGAITAFEFSNRDYTLLLPVDTPLAKKSLLESLIQLCEGHGAVIPSWPNGFVEPLHGVYLTEHAYAKGLQVMASGKRRMQDLIKAMTNVLYVTTEVLREFDPNLDTFANINTPEDLRSLEKRT